MRNLQNIFTDFTDEDLRALMKTKPKEPSKRRQHNNTEAVKNQWAKYDIAFKEWNENHQWKNENNIKNEDIKQELIRREEERLNLETESTQPNFSEEEIEKMNPEEQQQLTYDEPEQQQQQPPPTNTPRFSKFQTQPSPYTRKQRMTAEEFKAYQEQNPKQPRKLPGQSPYKKSSTLIKRAGIPQYQPTKFKAQDIQTYGTGKGIQDIRVPVGRLQKKRPTRWNKEDYDPLMDLVLNRKKAIRPFNIYTKEQARKYAEPRGYQYNADEDLDGDGINDVIIYNRAGEPVIVNGYGLTNSQYPYKKAYYEGGQMVDLDADGTLDTKGTYKQFLKGKWGYQAPNQPWEDALIYEEEPEEIKRYARAGYDRLSAPRTSLSIFQAFMKMYSKTLNKALQDMGIRDITKAIKPIQILNLMYIRFVVMEYAAERGMTIQQVYENNKTKNGKADFRAWFANEVQTKGDLNEADIRQQFLETDFAGTGYGILEYLGQDFVSRDYGHGTGGLLNLINVIKQLNQEKSNATYNQQEHINLQQLLSDAKIELENATANIKERYDEAVKIVKGEIQ